MHLVVGHKEQNIRIFYLRDVIPLKKRKPTKKSIEQVLVGRKILTGGTWHPLLTP